MNYNNKLQNLWYLEVEKPDKTDMKMKSDPAAACQYIIYPFTELHFRELPYAYVTKHSAVQQETF